MNEAVILCKGVRVLIKWNNIVMPTLDWIRNNIALIIQEGKSL